MKIIPFDHYLLFTRNYEFPAIKSREHLAIVLGSEMQANEMWLDYVEWHIALAPATRSIGFRKWMKIQKRRKDADRHEIAFIEDCLGDKDFPVFVTNGLDKILDYLSDCGAVDNAVAAAERLWIKFRTR